MTKCLVKLDIELKLLVGQKKKYIKSTEFRSSIMKIESEFSKMLQNRKFISDKNFDPKTEVSKLLYHLL